jgi:ribosomal protein S12 methylthiotransferase accessory factor
MLLIQQDASEPARPYVMGAELANHRLIESEPHAYRACSGKGLTLATARVSTLGEALERYAATSWDASEIVYGRRGDLMCPALDPRELVLYTPDQYAHLPFDPYTGENVLGWTSGRSLVTGAQIFVPALAVYLNYTMRAPGELLCPITSNGLATGATLAEAILAATCEVLERDAFMITWLNRLPCQRVDLRSHPDPEVRALWEAYRRRNVAIHIYRLPTDQPCHVFAAVAMQLDEADGPAVVVGLGADLAATHAARKAVLEMAQVRPTLRQRMRSPENRHRMRELVANPQRVSALTDHDLLYASREAIGALDFLLDRPIERFDWQAASPSEEPISQLERLVDHCCAERLDLVYINLTPADLEQLGLHTVRVILPGFQPIHFGWNQARLAGERLYELPRRLGFTSTRSTPAELNADPHPLA